MNMNEFQPSENTKNAFTAAVKALMQEMREKTPESVGGILHAEFQMNLKDDQVAGEVVCGIVMEDSGESSAPPSTQSRPVPADQMGRAERAKMVEAAINASMAMLRSRRQQEDK